MKPQLHERRHLIEGIAFFLLAVLTGLSLFTYHPTDLPFETSQPNQPVENAAGIFGAYVAWVLRRLFGWPAFSVPVMLGLWGWLLWSQRGRQRFLLRLGGLGMALASTAGLAALPAVKATAQVAAGGIIGWGVAASLERYFGGGAWLVAGTVAVLAWLLATEWMLIGALRASGPFALRAGRQLRVWGQRLRRRQSAQVVPTAPQGPRIASTAKPETTVRTSTLMPRRASPDAQVLAGAQASAEKKPSPTRAPGPKAASAARIAARAPSAAAGGYRLPSLDLLDPLPPPDARRLQEDLRAKADTLVSTLRDFTIEVQVTDIEQGPILTRYELQPAPGVKIQRIASLADDLALALKAQSIRIVAPIPGKARVGVEVPNGGSSSVYLREVLSSQAFHAADDSKLTLAIGKDVAGAPLVADLTDCPHLLIAGTTGSGKTVCLNSLLAGLLFAATPDELKLLLVDPKMVELSPFNGIPHLIAPTVTEAKRAAAALRWAVEEMESRYQRLAETGVRNIAGYNARLAEIAKAGGEENAPLPMPYLVIVIDELADLMLIAAGEVEETIARLSQLSRAVGIHMILATQRPSVDVITGVIKANFPARISFQVASKVDSRTVLDANGADKLLGRGDLLFMKPGESKLIRAQGSFISDREIERLVNFVKAQRPASYDPAVLEAQEQGGGPRREFFDELYEEAKRVVIETRQASTSALQRRLGLGYTRAARLIDMMEQEGVVGPLRGSKPRDILVERPPATAAPEPSATPSEPSTEA